MGNMPASYNNLDNVNKEEKRLATFQLWEKKLLQFCLFFSGVETAYSEI